MALPSREKLIAQLTQQEYALLKSLTDVGPLDAKSLEASVNAVVRDRLAFARSFIEAARVLAASGDPLIRRGSVSRAYYGAYHAARATVFAIRHHDEDHHGRVAQTIDSVLDGKVAVGGLLKELRLRRDELEYSPYPGPNDEAQYDAAETEDLIQRTLQQAEEVVRSLETHLRERR